MKKIGILYHPKADATRVKAEGLEKFLRTRGIEVWVCSSWEPKQIAALLDGTGVVLTVGGDGTILRAVEAIAPATSPAIPVTGINLGQLGFLTELDADNVEEKLAAILDDQGWIDERAMIQAEVMPASGEPRVIQALNDIVVARGDVARLVRINASVNGKLLTSYRADGVIMATATGTTGYALSAGSPVLYPYSKDFVMVPVSPHLTSTYPVVLPETAVVTLQLHTYHSATLTVDGHSTVALGDNDIVTVRHSPYTARFLRLRPKDSFFGSLEEKLRGRQGDTG